MTALACHFPGCAHPATVGRLCRMHGGGRPTSTSPVQRVHTAPLSSVPTTPRPAAPALAMTPPPAPTRTVRTPRPRPVSLVEQARAPRADLELTQREKILVAAIGLEVEVVDVCELVVACWRRWPRAWGLRGFEQQYPDSNKVLAKLWGLDGVVALGWLARGEHEGKLIVTAKGRRIATALLRREPVEVAG